MRPANSIVTKALLAAGLTWIGVEAVRRSREDNLRGEVALVTGGSRGLGFLIAHELGRAGCRLAICARNQQELEAASADLMRYGIEVLPVVCDVVNQGAIARMIDQVMLHYGRIDILVNNAGLIQVGPAQNMTAEHFHQAMDTIFWGTFYHLPHRLSGCPILQHSAG